MPYTDEWLEKVECYQQLFQKNVGILLGYYPNTQQVVVFSGHVESENLVMLKSTDLGLPWGTSD